MKPIVAIVGRANVGKSRLFNRLIGYRKALVDDSAGVTRDRHYAPADWAGHEFIAVDTGGIDLDPAADIEKKVTEQSLHAIAEADVVVCVLDSQVEPMPHDKELARKLKKIGKPVIFALNKTDLAQHESRAHEYQRMGAHPLVLVSAEHGRGVDDLLEEVVRHFPPRKKESPKIAGRRITVVGRPNVGKSTLINRLAGGERVIVHETAGTTRDAIDVDIEFEGRHYVFIDTAGVRKHFSVTEHIERFSAMRSLRTIDRSDIVIQLIDAADGLTHQDLNLAGFIYEQGKGMLLLVNKWDEIKIPWKDYEDEMRARLKELHDVSIFAISAKTGYHCLKIFEGIDKLSRALETKVSTSELNRILEDALAGHNLPAYRGKAVRVYYATQTGTRPPTFTLFANYPAAVPYAYRQYLIHRFQEALGVEGVPVRVIFRKKT
jgi:GTP-binding protein